MAFGFTNQAVINGGGIAIPGAVKFVDTSGTGVGPHMFAHSIVDPNGVNAALVGAGGALSVADAQLHTDLLAVEGYVDGIEALLTTLNGKDFATQTTLSSILAKIIAGSSTAFSDSTRLPVSQLDGLAVGGTATSAAVLFTQDMLNYESISVQVTSAGGTCTITYETSDDNVTFAACLGHSAGSTTTVASTSAVAGIMVFPRYGRYFRARVSTYGSGTVTVVGTCSKVAKSMLFSGQVVTVGGSVTLPAGAAAHGVAVSNNPLRGAARARDFGTPYTAVAADQTADFVANFIGHLKVTREHLYSHISTATTTTPKSGKGLLSKIIVNSGVAAATATVYDNTAGSGTVIAVIDCANPRQIELDIAFGTGLTIVTSSTADITVAYL